MPARPWRQALTKACKRHPQFAALWQEHYERLLPVYNEVEEAEYRALCIAARTYPVPFDVRDTDHAPCDVCGHVVRPLDGSLEKVPVVERDRTRWVHPACNAIMRAHGSLIAARRYLEGLPPLGEGITLADDVGCAEVRNARHGAPLNPGGVSGEEEEPLYVARGVRQECHSASDKMSQPDWRALPFALRAARATLGLSCSAVAEGVGISYSYYWQMEHADRPGASPGYRGLAKTWRPSRHVVLAMCRVLGLDPAVLLPMAGHMTKRPIPDPA